MRRTMFVGLAVCALWIGGCAVADTLFGTKHNEDGTVTSSPGGGVVGGVASALGFGWVTTLLGAGTTAYAAWKSKGWKAAAVATFEAVEAWKKGNPDRWEGLKLQLGAAHAEAHVTALVDKALDKEGINKA